MHIILSRKGFDSQYGACPSPILPDGTLLSMPIPETDIADSIPTYEDLQLNGMVYDDVWKALGKKYVPHHRCHLDPDLRFVNQKCSAAEWKPAFGQCEAAQSHLENRGVQPGDLFLFFGLYRKAFWNQEHCLKYEKGSHARHVIYGWLQIGEILRGNEISDRYPWHPHATPAHQALRKNTLYVPSDELQIPSVPSGIPGYGMFSFDEKYGLTLPGETRLTHWKLHDWMRSTTMSYHSPNSLKGDYFQSASKGQEFVIEGTPQVLEWVATLF